MILDIADVSTKNSSCFYVVSEECKPGDLGKHLLSTKKNLPEAAVLKIFAQIVMVLEEMHSQRVMHKKLQISHVLLDGNKHDIKICSLGSCRMLGLASATDTNPNRPRYSSPEMVVMALAKAREEKQHASSWIFDETVEDKTWTFETDIWALGILLFEMVTLDIVPDETTREAALTSEHCLSKIQKPYL